MGDLEKLIHNLQQLISAVGILVEEGTIQERMHRAYFNQLIHVQTDGLPEEQRDKFQAIVDRLEDVDSRTLPAAELVMMAQQIAQILGLTSMLYGWTAAETEPEVLDKD